MGSFLNIDLDNKIERTFLWKHILFTFFWLLGILIFLFRIDVMILNKPSLSWLISSLPVIYFISLFIFFLFLKWYYILAFFFYPFLMIFWFIPKSILRNGKLYLFANYLSALFKSLVNIKATAFNTSLLLLSIILLLATDSILIKWFVIGSFSYFYLSFVYKLLEKSFKGPLLFDVELEEKIQKLIDRSEIKVENSIIIRSYIIQKDEENLELTEKQEKQIRRALIVKYALDLLSNRLNSFKGRKAFIISWMFSSIKFLLISILFFWFLNYQLHKTDSLNFIYNGSFPRFDFLYYTLKTITFGDIELVKPISVSARISEISSFSIIGIFLLIIFISIFLSIKQDKMNEDIKLTTQFFESENLMII